jgi:hypothetical protein
MELDISEPVAGACVEHAGVEEDGADQQIDDVKHWNAPGSSASHGRASGGRVATMKPAGIAKKAIYATIKMTSLVVHRR